ncbi:uncharacterized protein LOC132555929 [Ylistrum balloti]|uniref:uncharacterized protein LOC132555929 n=1 Tax=Ylistrum balloti TaxID=509963 RepID=UPI002905AE07|nr:uncharacterized protein LOC132555929 [Ylistrum balloti]
MVYKINRCRVHSGNTLRASNSRYNREYRRQSCLVRDSQNVSRETTILEELGLDEDNVAYSLNKTQRWLVPQVLKHEILTENNGSEDIKISLVESHKLKKQANCTGFYSNKGFLRRMIPRDKTYFNAGSVLGSQAETTNPQVTVNILYPCPETSSITHNPKYLRVAEQTSENVEPDSNNNTQRLTNPTKRKSKRHRRKTGTKQRLNEYLDDVEYSDKDDYELDDPCTTDDVCARSNAVSVGDILHHSRLVQNILSETTTRKPAPHCSDFKDRIVYMDKPGDEAEKNDTQKIFYQKKGIPKAYDVKVYIPYSDVIPERLSVKYGKNYTECRCYPRKFIIDITKRVKRTILNSKAFFDKDLQCVDFSSALVFVYDMFDGLDCAELGLFKVFLNMNTTPNERQICTLLENDVFDIDVVINRAISYTETIPYDQFVHKLPPYRCSDSSATYFEILNEGLGATKTIYTSNGTAVQDIIHNTDGAAMSEALHPFLGVITLPPEICSVCFDAILDKSATALQTCGHWFCNSCWNEHLIASVNGMSGSITCPEYNCQSKVDFNILLTTSPFNLVERVFRRNRDRIIENDTESKWCPNKHCGRVLKYKKTRAEKGSNVTCDCGTQMCFDCLHSAHWPLSCDQYKSYADQLHKNGDDKFYLTALPEQCINFVRVKRCPNCGRFIENGDGCAYMPCVCNKAFCWGCGKSFSGHVFTLSCLAKGGTKMAFVELADEVKSTGASSNAYKHAVKNRFLRQPQNLRQMASAVHEICRKLTNLNRRYGNRIGGELAEFKVTKSSNKLSVREKFAPFLRSMIRVYAEVSHITEFTTIFLANVDCEEKIGSPKHVVSSILARLEGLGEEIMLIFRLASHQDSRNCISQLWQVRFQCRKVINSLIRMTSR